MHLDLDLEPGDAELFREESLELVQALEVALLELESGATSSATVDSAFRAAHTLKGSAATIGHARMADLTHAMEDLLGLLRDDPSAPAARIAGELLGGVDVVRVLVDEVEQGRALTKDVEGARARFVGLFGELSAPGSAPEPARTLPAAAETADNAALVCRIAPTSEWRAVRMLQIVMDADASGRLLASVPDLAAIEADQVGDEIRLTLARNDDTTALEEKLRAIEEVASVERVSLDPPAFQDENTAVVAVSAGEPAAVAGSGLEPAPAHEAAPGAPGAAPSAELPTLRTSRTTIRVDVARLDEVMNLVGELIVLKNRLEGHAGRTRAELGDHDLTIQGDEIARQFGALGSQVHDAVTALRMLPVATVFDGLPRLARDVAARLDREVGLVVEGSDVELDRAILEGLGGILTHVVRNAIDHGLEPPDEREAQGKPRAGRVTVAAAQSEGRVSITVADDGRGVDPARVRRAAIARGLLADGAPDRLRDEAVLDLLFEPGFSTAERVTDVSGRGVGLDAVRADVTRLGGTVTMTSTVGAGSTVTLSLPLTLAIVDALLVRSGTATCAIPMTAISETLRVEPAAIQRVAGRRAIVLRGRVIEVVELAEALSGVTGTPAARAGRATRAHDVVVVRTATGEVALGVDGLLGHQEIVIKRVEGLERPAAGIAGATILPDGGVALVVDVQAFGRAAQAPRPLPRSA